MVKDIKVGEIASKKVFSLEAHETLSKAFVAFMKFGYSYIPVYGKPGHFLPSSAADESKLIHNGKQYISVLTLTDCVAYLLQDPSHTEQATIFQACGAAFTSQSIWIVDPERQLHDILEPMAKGVHFFLIGTKNPNEELNILSQTDILRFVYSQMQNNPDLRASLSLPVLEFEISRNVVTVSPDNTIISVLQLMIEKALGSVGVVKDGILVDFFSISDLKLFLFSSSQVHTKMIQRLVGVTVGEYLRDLRAEKVLMGDKTVYPGVICISTSTIADAIEYALFGKVHHVWVVEGIAKHERKPIGAITSGKLPVRFGIANSLGKSATSSPPGANDQNCKPSVDSLPVVMVHGTFENQATAFATLSPILSNMGRCTYSLNYGRNVGQAFGLSDMYASAKELGQFVDQVLRQTGMPKVDIIGHSQGGMLPNIYIKKFGGDLKVNQVIGLGSSNGGTTFNGIASLGGALTLGVSNVAIGAVCQACMQQIKGSALYRDPSLQPLTSPGVKYTVISTMLDEINTPYTGQQLLGSNVQNLVVQDGCPQNRNGHVGIMFDKRVMTMVTNFLT